MADFFQSPPALENQFTTDVALRALLERLLPAEAMAQVTPELEGLGARAVDDIARAGDRAESEPPRHVSYDAWGRRIDDIVTSEAWKYLDRISAEEGLVARGYERRFGPWSRVDQLARLYLFHPSSATYSCPLAMTDGAARCLELYGQDDQVLRDAFAHLTSRDPARFWTSGQWMTERTGGSDVSGTSTIATRSDLGWRLSGTKWFTSATTAQMAITLARPEGAAEGSAGLSLFFVRLRDEDGALQRIRVNRLKEKLGTHALPTAELTLDGTPAILIGGEGDGVRKVAALLNITRLYNACAAVAGMRRALALATDYARRRVAFGRAIVEHPLHAETLAAMQLEVEGALQLVFHVGALLGREEGNVASESERALLRLLTPVVKLYTGKQAVALASEALEAFGGAGYVEDTGLPRLLRDAQVLSIWEGTTNVLSLDVLRALERTDALAHWLGDVERRLATVLRGELASSVVRVREAAARIGRHASAVGRLGRDSAEAGARALAFSLARTTAAALLLEQAQWSTMSGATDRRVIVAAQRWCAGDLAPLVPADAGWIADSAALLPP